MGSYSFFGHSTCLFEKSSPALKHRGSSPRVWPRLPLDHEIFKLFLICHYTRIFFTCQCLTWHIHSHYLPWMGFLALNPGTTISNKVWRFFWCLPRVSRIWGGRCLKRGWTCKRAWWVKQRFLGKRPKIMTSLPEPKKQDCAERLSVHPEMYWSREFGARTRSRTEIFHPCCRILKTRSDWGLNS